MPLSAKNRGRRVCVSGPTECDASTGNGMSMADDNTLRTNRSNDPYRRAAEPAREPAGSDPLAELARLIGQNDPMADFGRGTPRQTQPSGYSSHESAPQWPSAASAQPRHVG